MEKVRIKQTNQLSVSMASDPVLTMKWKCFTHTCYKAYEDIGSTKECKQHPDVKHQWQVLSFNL